MRTNTSNPNIIYHGAKCITTKEGLDKIRSNLTYFYGCEAKVLDPDTNKNITVPGIFVNQTKQGCVVASRLVIFFFFLLI